MATAAATSSGGTFRSLRHRNARLFFIGLLASNVGSWMQSIATSLLVYRITGKGTDLGFVVALQFGPMLLLGGWAGVLADRTDKLRMTMITQALMAVQALALGVLDASGHATVGSVYALTLVLGIVSAFDNPARRGFVTELVEPEEIGNAVSLNTAVMTGSRIFGPALAAILVGPLGTSTLFLANGVSYAAILLALFAIDRSKLHPAPRAPRTPGQMREALAYIRHDERILAVFVAFTIVATFAFNYSVSLPKLADESWGGEAWFGWILAVTSIGSLLGSLQTASRLRVTVRFMAVNGVILGAAGVLMAFAPNVWVAMIMAVPLGLGGAAFVAAMNAITQQECPPAMRGRVLALGAIAFLGSTPIGGPITGWIGDHIGAEWALAYGGIITLATMVGLYLWSLAQRPELRSASALWGLRPQPAMAPPASVEHP